MNEEERAAIVQLVTKYSDVFHQEGAPLSSTIGVKHVIRTTDEIPVYARNYRFPEIYLKEVDQQMDELIRQGIVRNSVSPWNAPIWVVPKKLNSSDYADFYAHVNPALCENTLERDVVNFIKEYIKPKTKYRLYFNSDVYEKFANIVNNKFIGAQLDLTKYNIKLLDVLDENEQTEIIANYHNGNTNHRGSCPSAELEPDTSLAQSFGLALH
ncbi:unnamed protein product [Nesidiocoris tenuis]|uniref:Uncharacterized protein n=1 Tax=Nesidiocoris tenuis TaxID=355587 RepID=A0A6H5GD48_9HEMI|nr:unnamed protein product [Nesidiocoris tenuis]